MPKLRGDNYMAMPEMQAVRPPVQMPELRLCRALT